MIDDWHICLARKLGLTETLLLIMTMMMLIMQQYSGLFFRNSVEKLALTPAQPYCRKQTRVVYSEYAHTFRLPLHTGTAAEDERNSGALTAIHVYAKRYNQLLPQLLVVPLSCCCCEVCKSLRARGVLRYRAKRSRIGLSMIIVWP